MNEDTHRMFQGPQFLIRSADEPPLSLGQIRRDIMACFAMNAMLTHDADSSFPFIAEASYRMADFMIAQAERPREGGPG